MEDEKNTGFHKYLLIVICFVGQIQIQILNVVWLSFVLRWQLHRITKHALQIPVIFRNNEKRMTHQISLYIFSYSLRILSKEKWPMTYLYAISTNS